MNETDNSALANYKAFQKYKDYALKMISKLEKIKAIGKGNYGKAILCKNIHDSKIYVLKSIDISQFNNSQINSALLEVNLLKSLNWY